MMDASLLYPEGFHHILDDYLPDIAKRAPVRERVEVWPPVDYYSTDFDISSSISTSIHPKLNLGRYGRDQEVPELSNRTPCNPVKVDIFIIGNLLRKELYAVRDFPVAHHCHCQ